MPSSAPTQKFEIDLDGTGSLYDVSTYVDDPAGVTASAGRTDWTSAEPNAGTLVFTLKNFDGRFTPGSTTFYKVGVLAGVLVQWTIGTRVRRYRISVPSLTFPTGRYSQSMVIVSCTDALAILAAKTMRSMLEEATLATLLPAGYWLLDDGSTIAPVVGCVDSSGHGMPLFNPVGNIAALQPGGADGPPVDGVGAMYFNQVGALVTTVCALYLAGGPTLGATPLVTYQPNPGQYQGLNTKMGFSMFFNIDDIYGSTFSTVNGADGPFVVLATFDHPESMMVLYRIADRKLWIASPTGGYIRLIGRAGGVGFSPTVSPGVTHHLVLAWNYDAFNPNYMNFTFAFDGTLYPANPGQILFAGDLTPCYQVALGCAAINGGTNSVAPMNLSNLSLGSYGVGIPAGTVNMFAYALQGTISNFTLFGTNVVSVLPIGTDPYQLPILPANVATIYGVGMTGPTATSDVRFLQLGGYDGHPEIGYAVQGTPQTDLLDYQATTGSTLLAAMCVALRGEDACLEAVATSTTETVQAWLTSTQRTATPALVFDIENELDDVPKIAFDPTGIAVTATAQGRAVTAVWTDTSAPARLAATSASVNGAQLDPQALLRLAQYRTGEGRTSKLALSSIKIDTRIATSDLVASLLALRPGLHIQVSIPAAARAVFGGYAAADGYVIGTAEIHTLAANEFTINIQPAADAVEAQTDPQDSTTVTLIDRLRCDGPAYPVFMAGFTTATTAFTIIQNNAATNDPGKYPMFSTDSTDYPASIFLTDSAGNVEVAQVSATPAAAVYSGAGVNFQQTMTLVRGSSPVSWAGGGTTPTISVAYAGVAAY